MPSVKGKTRGALTKRQLASIALAKQYRKEAAQLKRKGILSAKVNARKDITRATRTKINKFRDVLEGRAIAVPAPRATRQQYEQSETLPTVGRFILAPKEYQNQTARIKRGLVSVARPLKNGQEEYVILPFKPTDLPNLIRRLQTDPTLDGLKLPDEFFSFRLYGHNANDAFIDAKEMGDHLAHYIARLGGNSNVVKHITFQRFKTNDTGEFMQNPHDGKEPKVPYNSNKPRAREGTLERQRKATRAKRKAAARSRETPDERAARLKYQQQYQARYRQRKFEEGL